MFVSAVAFEVLQQVATLTWMGHGFGLRRAQLLALNPKRLHIYAPKP